MPSAHNSSPPYNEFLPGYFDRPETMDNPVSVADQRAAGVPAGETVTMAAQAEGQPLHESYNPGDGDGDEGDDDESAGTSSSASDKRPDKSGSSGTPDLPSPAPETESPSGKDQAQPAAPSSTAPSTDGSTQETGPSPQGQPDSSEATEASGIPDQDPDAARALLVQARGKYDGGDYDAAEELVDQAALLAPGLAEIGEARSAIDAARAAHN